MRRLRLRAILLAVGLLLAACSGADQTSASSGAGDAGPEEEADMATAPAGVGEELTDVAAGAQPADDGGAEGGIAGDAAASPVEGEPVPDAALAAERRGERIIKEGSMTVEVGEDGYQRAFQRVVSTATSLGGAVVSSTTRTTEDGATSGTVTVRVPVAGYEDLLASAGDIGTVRSQDITSQDVTAEFVDLEARLRHEQAQEAFYLGLLEDAAGVQDAIAVQQQLTGIQERIEQLRGRLNVLDDRTSFSTLTVELVEPDTTSLLADEDPGSLSIAAYIDRAARAFVTVVGWLIVLAGATAPVLVPLLIAALAWRLFRRPAPARGAATMAADSD